MKAVAHMNKWQTPYTPNCRTNRAVTLAVILALIVILLVLLMQPSGASLAGSGQAPVYVEHVVAPGEILWSIALYYRPDADPWKIVWLIQEASGCTALIRPGQVLRVPVVE